MKQRFGLVLMRWVAVLVACYFMLQFDFLLKWADGKALLVLLVATYVVASIVGEIAPALLLRGTPAEIAQPVPRTGARNRR